MATQLFMVDNGADNPPAGSPSRGTNDANLAGTNVGWSPQGLRTTRGGGQNPQNTDAVNGPTSGIELGSPSIFVEFVSEPIAAGVTVSGTMTFNFWGLETAMTTNAGFQCVVERLDNTGAIVSTVVNSERGVELATSTAANNWTATPTSTTFAKGDRIRVRVAFNDAGGTMVAGANALNFASGAATSGVTGDSWVQFTETITFMQSDPTGSTLYLTSTSSPASGSGTSLEAWTSRGGGSADAVTNTVAGYTAPIQITATAGGTVVEWYTRPLQAFTWSGMCKFNAWVTTADGAVNFVTRAEVARTNGDGSGATVIGASGENFSDAGGEKIYIPGPDTSISDGQRLRFRIFIDDRVSAMTTGHTVTTSYNGTTGGATGDTWVILPQSVSEFVAAQVPYRNPMPPLLAQ